MPMDRNNEGGSRPVPDPPLLTPQALEREVAALKSLFAEQLVALRELLLEMFKGVDKQFAARDVAVNAAFQAAKEAVGEQNKSSAAAIAKSENATTDQIKQIGTQITSNTKTTDDKIDDLKARLGTVEGLLRGVDRSEHRSDRSNQMWIGIIGIAVGAIIAIAAIVFRPSPQITVEPAPVAGTFGAVPIPNK